MKEYFALVATIVVFASIAVGGFAYNHGLTRREALVIASSPVPDGGCTKLQPAITGFGNSGPGTPMMIGVKPPLPVGASISIQIEKPGEAEAVVCNLTGAQIKPRTFIVTVAASER